MPISIKCDKCGALLTISDAMTKDTETQDLQAQQYKNLADIEAIKTEITNRLTQEFNAKLAAEKASSLAISQQNKVLQEQIASLLQRIQ